MHFYVLAKCVDSEKGDIIIDLDEKIIKSYRPLYELSEDQEYRIEEDMLITTNYLKWNMLKSYQLAFERGQDIHRDGFRFISIHEKDKIRLDNNGLLYINDLFYGKLVNQKEVDLFYKEGVDQFILKLEKSKKEGIRLLIKGKKIYRIFTKAKYKSLKDSILYGENLLDLIESKSKASEENQLEKVESDLKEAMELILGALDTISKVKKSKS